MKDKEKPEMAAGGKGKPRGKTILISVFLLAAVLICLVGFTQRNNLKALYLAATADTENLEQKLEDQGQKREDLLKEYGLEAPGSAATSQAGEPSGSEQPPQPGSSESSQQPVNGSGTESQTPETQPQQPEKQPETQPQQPEKPGELSEAAKQQIQAYVDELYVLEDLYMGKLNAIAESTKDEYHALPKEQQTKENKIALVKSKTQQLIAEEKVCDAEVEAILKKIQAVLDENKVKNNLVSDIRARYQDTKATWKAASMTKLYQ